MDDTSTRSGYLPDEAATLALGASLAQAIVPGTVIFLEGDLGAGKTTLTRGLLQGLGHQGRVKSPTYTLVETYPLASLTAHHFDLYRFNDPEEWEDAGFRELFGHDTLCLVEWPEKAQGLLPQPHLTLELAVADDGRSYRIHAHDAQGIQCLSRLSI
ncbi:tRNA (adenosine(37)-N6)-threonylcarbamoyltransferase complex ATPase subunit type 1 TsaE [Craterilacuibacter sp. RT1T]|uniref:tRNA (adenosine(37)-N6)-threonylcarbamoyltransferase complex ATPase subunit type 1 TsaE n=1 Tax=Craterilacuibacter sp. RT1T TaxID=2942211 RepID=UPI0020C078B5|nr:tRNA (adenosine(37)-N6)-threonylcarbamoyltransferase complex ATPase subunit type 1 TsaE [Craterilacuibacter sp. RT1T]MCL6263610.1 tRNA (adenosine(37)-N6)-threonylcarbamoyltransferase complex ATPase subunit type 1 TsaE [Craterilacuibacter sp. RT1T]